MNPLVVLRNDRPTGRAAPLVRDRVRVHSLARAPSSGPASQAFVGCRANRGLHRKRPANLKPNIYYKAQDFALGAHWVPGSRDVSRADRHLAGTSGDERVPVGPGIDDRKCPTETLCAPEWTARAGSLFDEPAAWRVEDTACDF
jgi:hypothetical protein